MLNKKTILLVEDEAPLREALREKLQHEGFEVLVAKNGEEGLGQALAHHPDLILLDIIMPKMDGITALESLRLDPWGSRAHVIMLTNLNDSAKVAEAIKQHAFDYFVKSDSRLTDVVERIKERLSE